MVDRTFLSKFLAAVAAAALLLALPATAGGLDGVPPIAGPSQEYPEGSPGSLAAGLNLMVDAPASVATTDTPFAIDIRYANGLPEAQVVTLDYIEVQSGTRYERFDIGKAVPSVTSDLAALWRVDSDVSASPANRSTAADDVRAHIGKVKTNATPRELMTASNETTVTVKATAHFTVDAAPVMVTSSTTVGIAAYADAPVGWLAGDGHVHSEYSDGSGTVAEDAAAAAATGLDFMVITDHADKMTARDFGTELSECDAATYATGVRTIMGQEYPHQPRLPLGRWSLPRVLAQLLHRPDRHHAPEHHRRSQCRGWNRHHRPPEPLHDGLVQLGCQRLCRPGDPERRMALGQRRGAA